MRPRCAHTNGVTENSASPTRRHRIISASRHPITPTSSPSPPHRHHHRTHRRGATTLCHNPVRGAQRSVPGLDTPLLSACRRYATTANIPTQHQRRAYGVRSISPTQHQRIAHSVRSISLTQHQRRAYGASETRYCIITPFARRDSGGRMGHRRPTITRRFGDALLLQRQSMTARAVTSSVNRDESHNSLFLSNRSSAVDFAFNT